MSWFTDVVSCAEMVLELVFASMALSTLKAGISIGVEVSMLHQTFLVCKFVAIHLTYDQL